MPARKERQLLTDRISLRERGHGLKGATIPTEWNMAAETDVDPASRVWFSRQLLQPRKTSSRGESVVLTSK
jgi:hypothetical protein